MYYQRKTAKELGIKVGDQFRVVRKSSDEDGDNLPIGTLIKLTCDDDTDLPYFSELGSKEDDECCLYFDQLEPYNVTNTTNKGDKKMNIVTYAKLNKNQRTLYKVGIVDTDGHLTSEGRNVVLDMLAADANMQTKLIDIAKEYKKDQKED